MSYPTVSYLGMASCPAGLARRCHSILTVLLAWAAISLRVVAQPGFVEPAFTVEGLRTATALAVTPEGRVLVSGNFTNAPSGAAVVLLAEDGSVAWRSDVLQVPPQIMAAGATGEIYGGADNRASRFLPPSTAPDPAFVSGNGWRSSDPWALAVQPGGGLLIAGSGVGGVQMDWQTERGLRMLPFRILSNGARDVAFGTRVGTGPCVDLAVEPDGSFLAVRGTIQRFLADGTPDSGFTPWTAANVEMLRRLPGGDYLVGGGALTAFNGAPAKTLIRVGPTGVRDAGFEYAGAFDVAYDAGGSHRPLAVLGDGRLVVGQPGGGIRRFLANGAADPSWTDPAPGVVVRELVADAAGRVYVIGPLEGVGKSRPLYRLAGDQGGPVDAAPVFVAQPASSTALEAGGGLTLSVEVGGRPEPALQWTFNGAALPGQTGKTLSLPGFQAANAGAYQVVASNRVGVVRSAVAGVFLSPGAARPGSPDVTFEAPGLNPPAGVAGFLQGPTNPLFWGGDGAADGGVYLWGNLLFRQGDGRLQTGVVRLDAEGGAHPGFRPGDTVRDAGGGVLDPEGRLVLGAVFVAGGQLVNGVVRLLPDGTVDPAFTGGNLFEGTQQAAARLVARDSRGGYLVAGGFSRVAGVARPGLIRLGPDGVLDASFVVLPVSSRVTSLSVAPDGGIYLGGSFSLPGATTEVSLLRLNPDGTRDPSFVPLKTIGGLVGLEGLPGPGGVVGLTAGVAQTQPTVLGSLFRLGIDGRVDPGFDAGLPNRIGEALLRRPDGSYLVAGVPASAPGAPGVARHLSGGILDPSHTNAPAFGTVRSLRPGTEGRVWVILAALPGAVRLRADDYVPPATPVFVRPPRSVSAVGQTAATFRVVADGVRPLTYQWRFNGVPIPGQTLDLLGVAPITPDKLGTYDVVVTGGGRSATSPPAQLSNQFPPEITAGAFERTNVFVGATVTLSVAATGTAPLAYQWRRNGVDLPGATGPELVLASVGLEDGAVYTVRVSNAAGEIVSRESEVKVSPLPVAPSIIREPEDVLLLAGLSRVCLDPGVAGTPPFAFQWQRDGVDVPGATTVGLCLGPLAAGESGRYRLVVTNAQGRAATREVQVTVVPPVFAITDGPDALNLVPDQAAVFMVQVRNDAGRPLTYRWQRDGIDLAGATNAVLRLDPPTEADAGARFRVIVSDGVETLTSDAAATTANPEVTACPGGTESIFRIRGRPLPVTLGVDARGFGTLTYQWRRGPAQVGKASPLEAFVPVPGATGPTLTLTAPTDADVGDYFCEVRSASGTSVSDPLSQLGAMRVRLVDDDTRPGRVDFGWDYLALGEVHALNGVEFLPDGRVYVAGAFGNPFVGCSPLRLVARLNPDGSLDPAFRPVTASLGTAVGLVRQPSGKVVIAGGFRGLDGIPDPGPGLSLGWARFHPDGTPDPSFVTAERGFDGSGGIQVVGQSDGRILIERQGVVYRLLPDGGRDTGFGGPIPSAHSPGIETVADVRRMIVDAQDRIYLLNADTVRRYLPDGQPDPAWAVTRVPENLVRMAVGPDGRAVATGYAPGSDPGAEDLRVVRFNADGTRDGGFNPVYPAGGTIAGAPAVQPDGRVLIGGTAGTLSGRLLADGGRDAAWEAMASPGGAASPAFDPYWFVAPDGRVLVAGHAFDDGIGFANLAGRRLFRLQNGGSALGQVRLEAPRFVDGRIEFQIPTEPGRVYQVQFLGNLADAGGATGGWSTQQTVAGDGTAKSVSLGTPGSVGFYRVVVAP